MPRGGPDAPSTGAEDGATGDGGRPTVQATLSAVVDYPPSSGAATTSPPSPPAPLAGAGGDGDDADASVHLLSSQSAAAAVVAGGDGGVPATTTTTDPLPPPPSRRARWFLYASHALSTTLGRGWEFGAALALFALAPDSLALPAALGLAESLAQALGGPALGRLIDAWPRMAAATRFVLAQAACTVASAGAVLAALNWGKAGSGLTPLNLGLGAVAIAAAAGAALGAAGATLSVEREWTAALAHGDAAHLAALNAGMRRIDLVALIAAPAAVGGVLSGAGPVAGTAAVAAAASIVAWPQLALLAAAQRAAPDRLGGGRASRAKAGAVAFAAASAMPAAGPSPRRRRRWCGALAASPSLPSALAAYFAAPAAPAAAALALLYCTVLSFGAPMTAYLGWRGLSAAELAGWRGAGAVAGLAATGVYPPARRAWGLDAAAAVGLAGQWACLGPAVVAVAAAPTVGAARALAAGLALSRAGLWGFDLAASQALQERVPPDELGAINGVQSSAQAGLGAVAMAACLAFSKPEHFAWLGVASLVVVTCASVVFGVGTAVVRRRERVRAGGGGGGVEMGGQAA